MSPDWRPLASAIVQGDARMTSVPDDGRSFGLEGSPGEAHHVLVRQSAGLGPRIHARTKIAAPLPDLGQAPGIDKAGLPATRCPLGNAGSRTDRPVQSHRRVHRRTGRRGIPALPSGHVQRGPRGPAGFSHASHARRQAACRHLPVALVAGPAGADSGGSDIGHPGLHLGSGGRGAWDRRHDPGLPSGRGHDPHASPADQVGGLDHHHRHRRVGRAGGPDRPDRLGVRILSGPGAQAAA